jgi:hypothetical protein
VAYVATYLLNNDARSTGFYMAGVPPPKVEQLLLSVLWNNSQQTT